VGFVENEVESAANDPPFSLDGGPGGLGGSGDLLGGGLASAACRGEVGDFVFDEGADEPEVVTGGGEDAVFAFGIPAGDAVFEFGRAVEVDF